MSSKKAKRPLNLKIEVHPEPSGGTFCLMVRSLAGLNPVGPRLARGEPLPVWDFRGLDEVTAQTNAFKLQSYLANETQ